MTQAQFFDTHGTAVLREIFEQIEDSVTPFGATVDEHPQIEIVRSHGFGFLTGVAATFVQSAGERLVSQKGSVADWESDLIEAANACILAVIAGRIVSAEADDLDEAGYPDLFDTDLAFPEIDEPEPEIEPEPVTVTLSDEQFARILAELVKTPTFPG